MTNIKSLGNSLTSSEVHKPGLAQLTTTSFEIGRCKLMSYIDVQNCSINSQQVNTETWGKKNRTLRDVISVQQKGSVKREKSGKLYEPVQRIVVCFSV